MKGLALFVVVLALTPVLKAKMAIASQVCYTDEMELQTQLFEGTCEGRIDFAPRGQTVADYVLELQRKIWRPRFV